MKPRDWLLTVGTLASGYLAGRYMHSNLSASEKPNAASEPTQPQLTRSDVIRLIETNGGPDGLDLSPYDLAEVDLSRLDLKGVYFSDIDSQPGKRRRVAKLERSSFRHSDLSKSNLTHVDLRNADFWHANLYEANLAFADAEGASFRLCNLQNANLYGCNLTGASLWRADLSGANLWVTEFSNAIITEINIGNKIIQEKLLDYENYHNRWYSSHVSSRAKRTDLENHFSQASEIYLNLKNAYLSHGRYREASWAYLKERRMRRATYVPWRAKRYYGELVTQNPGFLRWRWLRFYPKYTWRWFFDWLTDLTSGYGEKPLRTVWLALLIILVFPWLYWLSGQVTLIDNTPLQWIDYLIHSLGAFTTMDFTRFATTGWISETLASLEALLGISILALLMFALGNRISRS